MHRFFGAKNAPQNDIVKMVVVDFLNSTLHPYSLHSDF